LTQVAVSAISALQLEEENIVNRAVLIVVALAAFTRPAAADPTWEIDPAHTRIEFSVRHMMISNVHGEFGKFSGSVVGDEKSPTTAVVKATVQADSIDTREPKRDTHLKSADFFDVEHNPTIIFNSKKIEAAGAGHWKVTGDLTLHGVTRDVVLDVEGPTAVVKDPMGNTRAGAHATTRINRKDFGMTWSKSLDGGGLMVGDDVDITIDVEGVKRPETVSRVGSGSES
jgi:polyisoprenoid-binding protein YceI